ncbi:MAG: hypothetical protein JNL18_14245 [Planctomycetaceae bacterium]|nr:hypothetical protein [Lacipirellula limnantheis]MBL9163888.1 hypothetical protein [Planctomycetaceae bacterium]
MSRPQGAKQPAGPAPPVVRGHRGQLVFASILLAAWLLFLAAMAATA